MNSRTTLLLWLYRSKMNSKGQAPIYLRITVNGKKTELSTGVFVYPKLWNNKKGRVKGSSDWTKTLNEKLSLQKAKIMKVCNELLEMQLPISPEQLKNRFTSEETTRTLLEAMQYHIRHIRTREGVVNSKALVTKHETLIKKVKLFLDHEYNRKDIFLKECFFLAFDVRSSGRKIRRDSFDLFGKAGIPTIIKTCSMAVKGSSSL